MRSSARAVSCSICCRASSFRRCSSSSWPRSSSIDACTSAFSRSASALAPSIACSSSCFWLCSSSTSRARCSFSSLSRALSASSVRSSSSSAARSSCSRAIAARSSSAASSFFSASLSASLSAFASSSAGRTGVLSGLLLFRLLRETPLSRMPLLDRVLLFFSTPEEDVLSLSFRCFFSPSRFLPSRSLDLRLLLRSFDGFAGAESSGGGCHSGTYPSGSTSTTVGLPIVLLPGVGSISGLGTSTHTRIKRKSQSLCVRAMLLFFFSP